MVDAGAGGDNIDRGLPVDQDEGETATQVLTRATTFDISTLKNKSVRHIEFLDWHNKSQR